MTGTVTICAACFQSAHTGQPDSTGCQCTCHQTCSYCRRRTSDVCGGLCRLCRWLSRVQRGMARL